MTLYTVQNIGDIWWHWELRPIMSLMIVHGDLQMQKSEVIMAHLGNILAYCVEFATEFLEQLNHRDLEAEVYHHKDVK